MSNNLNSLLQRVAKADPALARDFGREIAGLSKRREFGLNFEKHRPETVELHGRRVRVGDKVRFIAPRGSVESVRRDTWLVEAVDGSGTRAKATLVLEGGKEAAKRAVEDLVVVADFRDPIYPGLISTGKVERGGDKPFQTVINSENYHALEAMLFTSQGQVDAIYIDPPYNTGAKDWKYNNDYVDGEDAFRHSKWLSFMERRLKLAKKLLNPDASVLIVTIDEKEYLRLGLLLEQTFPGAGIQMVTTITNPAGAGRAAEFSRTDEYIFFVRIGQSRVLPEQRDEERRGVTWDTLRRSDLSSVRPTRPGQFYPFYVNTETRRIEAIGEPLAADAPRDTAPARSGCVAVFPVRPDGTEMNWGITAQPARQRLAQGFIRVGRRSPGEPQAFVISYLTAGIIEDIENGRIEVSGRAKDGSVVAHYVTGRLVMPTTTWNRPSHDAQRYGTEINKALMPDRRFPFPKSLYAVEDALRYFVGDKADALIVDFFAGSGTTAHAVARLNKQDGGRRRCVVVTNNEVSAAEQHALRVQGYRPGDPEWEARGICSLITKPRVAAAVTGHRADGELVKGDYAFVDEFPMGDGFAENVEFFDLSYQDPQLVELDLAFSGIAPLLWMRAGATGRRIEDANGTFDMADTYGVLFSVDATQPFLIACHEVHGLRVAYIVTDDEKQFQMVAGDLPQGVAPVRLYETYLRTFEINTGKE